MADILEFYPILSSLVLAPIYQHKREEEKARRKREKGVGKEDKLKIYPLCLLLVGVGAPG